MSESLRPVEQYGCGCIIDSLGNRTPCFRHQQSAPSGAGTILERLRAMRHAPDEAFDWCDYDMEIEAAKVAFERAAEWLEAASPLPGDGNQ